MFINKFCEILPKLELHAHLNGSLSETTLKELGCISENVVEYQKLSSVDDQQSTRTLDECFKVFSIAHNATNTPTSVYTATQQVIDEFYNDNVIYLEIRSTPREEPLMTKTQYIQSVVDAINDYSNKSMIVKLILSIDRRHSSEKSLETLDIATEFKNTYPNIVKGLDLCGNPNEGCWHKDIFEEARRRGFFITLHCAEVSNVAETMEMMEFKPDRIGHGTFVSHDDEAWESYLKNPIPVECCLTSNVICETVKQYEDHHLGKWINQNLPFTLSTDDKGVFNTTLSKEFAHAATTFNLNIENLFEVSLNSIKFCFASDSEKEELANTMNKFKLDNENLFKCTKETFV